MPTADVWRDYVAQIRQQATSAPSWHIEGRLTRVAGLVLEAVGLRLPVGASCLVGQAGQHAVEAEVVGFVGERLYLMPVSDVYGLEPGMPVKPLLEAAEPPQFGAPFVPNRRIEDHGRQMPVGFELLGRIVDGLGRPLDKGGPLRASHRQPLHARAINPLDREPVRDPMDVGVRAINALLTVGRGQRLGLFAGSGVGKSVLLGMMARYTTADVVVVGLIGERGREVKDFIENILGDEGLRRAAVIAAPADSPPLMRLHGAAYATAVAEFFRDQGLQVLLIMDSLTRYAMAQREIALAIGEPPATKGYPPSVFAKLPALVERAGNARDGGGSITAFYTVLTEGDDQQDPIADAARAILDGHFVLSRQLAEQGHYPAIDIEASISRVMPQVVTAEHQRDAQRFKQLWSRYQQSRDLISVGAYVAGGDADTDLAIARQPVMAAYLRQALNESEPLPGSVQKLAQILRPATG